MFLASANVTVPFLQLYVREVQKPHGMLSGLGRRVSSLFFGSSPPDLQETRRVVCEAGRVKGSSLFVLTTTHLQRWNLAGPINKGIRYVHTSYTADYYVVRSKSCHLHVFSTG